MGVDLGINYYDPDNEWSLSLVAKNLGGQLKAYNDEFEKMPFDLQAGLSKKLTEIEIATNWYNSLEDLHKNYLEILGLKL
jgi:hypothetical protein